MKHLSRTRIAAGLTALAATLTMAGCAQGPTTVPALTFMKGDWVCAVTIPQQGQAARKLDAKVTITSTQATISYKGSGSQGVQAYPFTTKGSVLTAHPSDGSNGGWVVTLPENVHLDASNTVHVEQQSSGWNADVPVTATASKVTFSFPYPATPGKISFSCTPDHGNH